MTEMKTKEPIRVWTIFYKDVFRILAANDNIIVNQTGILNMNILEFMNDNFSEKIVLEKFWDALMSLYPTIDVNHSGISIIRLDKQNLC